MRVCSALLLCAHRLALAGRLAGRAQHLDQRAREHHLHHLLDDGQQAGVVHADAALEQAADPQDLRDLAVAGVEALDRVAEERLHLGLLGLRGEVERGEACGKTKQATTPKTQKGTPDAMSINIAAKHPCTHATAGLAGHCDDAAAARRAGA